MTRHSLRIIALSLAILAGLAANDSHAPCDLDCAKAQAETSAPHKPA